MGKAFQYNNSVGANSSENQKNRGTPFGLASNPQNVAISQGDQLPRPATSVRRHPMPALDPEDQTLESLLAFHGLSHWLPLLLEWCARFEGWYTASELYDEPTADFAPVSQVMLRLSQLPDSLNGSDFEFAVLMSGLDFVTWHALRETPREGWDPLCEAFRTFSSRGPIKIWEDDRPFAAPTTIRYWLLGRLYTAPGTPPGTGPDSPGTH